MLLTVHTLRFGGQTYQISRSAPLGSPHHFYVFSTAGSCYAATPAGAIAKIREARNLAGRKAAHAAWNQLCEEQAAIARSNRTAADVLRDPKLRDMVYEDLLDRGLKWSADLDYYCSRAVQSECRKLLGARRGRRTRRAEAELARTALPGRIARLIPVYAAKRAADKKAKRDARLAKALAGERVGRDTLDEILPTLYEQVSRRADQVIRCVVRAVGKIGEQCRADLAALETDRDGSIGKSHGKESETTLHRVEHLADWSAALITLEVHSHYYSRGGIGPNRRRHVGSNKYLVWLCVRDSSTGEAHLLRVPPKFGNAGTDFFRGFASPKARIKAAVAWTFDRTAAEYAPQVEA